MPFLTRTFEQIRDDFLRDLRAGIPGAKTQEGSDYWATAMVHASVVLGLYRNGQWASDQSLPDTCDASMLARFGSVWRVPRLGKQFAGGTGRATASFSTSIPDGSRLTNLSTGARYKTVGATPLSGTIPTGTPYLIALDAGTSGNAKPGTILNFDGAPPGVDPELVVISVSGGDVAWSDARWAAEILRKMAAHPQGGNIAHVLLLAGSVPGVEQPFYYPSLRGAGTNDVVIVTSAASGSRVAGPALLARVVGALQAGIRATDGDTIAGLPEDVFRNTAVHAIVEQPTDLLIEYRASAANAFESWPPYGPTGVIPNDETTWYVVAPSPTAKSIFSITKPTTGYVVTPKVGNVIGMYFASAGMCKSTIRSVIDSGAAWDVIVDAWSSSPTDNNVRPGAVIVPWNPMLPNLVGPVDSSSGSLSLTGAIPEYFAKLGPGEMTPLTADDETRRRRWPRVGDLDILTGDAAWPTDVTARLLSAIVRATDAQNVAVSVRSGSSAVPFVPDAAFLGVVPPSLLTLGDVFVIPTR